MWVGWLADFNAQASISKTDLRFIVRAATLGRSECLTRAKCTDGGQTGPEYRV